MATTKQKEANRKNAKKSTGPKTKEGKSESSKNAIKHGIYARQDVIEDENQVDYDMLRDELIEDLKPVGPMQRILAERIVSLTWRLERTVRMHNQAIDVKLEREGSDHDLALGQMANRDFTNWRVLDKLLMYERRIENSLYKTIKELKNLKNEKMKNEPNSTGERRATSDEKMQNEPNLNDQPNLTPAISKDYDLALSCEAPSVIPNQAEGSIKQTSQTSIPQIPTVQSAP